MYREVYRNKQCLLNVVYRLIFDIHRRSFIAAGLSFTVRIGYFTQAERSFVVHRVSFVVHRNNPEKERTYIEQMTISLYGFPWEIITMTYPVET
jgi:hypothetical protein